MKYCKTCNMKYEGSLTQCLFCNNPLTLLPDQDQIYLANYPKYERLSHFRTNFLKISSFLLIFANLLCLYIDYVTKKEQMSWSLYVFCGTLYTLLVIKTLASRNRWIKKLIQLVIVTDLFLLALGAALHNYHWCTDIVIPVTLMASNFLSLLMVIGKRERMFRYSVYPFFLSFLGLLYGLTLLTNVIANPWAVIVCIIYSGVTVAAIFIFAPKAAFEELLRRLHL